MTARNERDDVAEVTKLLAEHDKIAARNKKLEEQIAAMAERQRAARIRDETMAALEGAGCVRAELAFRVLRDELKFDAAGNVFAVAEIDGQRQEIDVRKYIEGYVKEKRLPEFFVSSRRPAAAGAGKDFDYTLEQIKDSEFYAANADAIREALSRGRVRMA